MKIANKREEDQRIADIPKPKESNGPADSLFSEDAFKEVNGALDAHSGESEDDGLDIDAILEKLVAVKNKMPGAGVPIELEDILKIVVKAERIISN